VLNIQAQCVTGYGTSPTNLIANADLSTLPTGTCTSSNPCGPAGSYPNTVPATTYATNITVQGKYSGVNQYPAQNKNGNTHNSFSIINNGNYVGPCCSINQVQFPGDPANAVPATSAFIYWNGTSYGGQEFLVYQTNLTGLTIGKTYTFFCYVSNTLEPANNAPHDPIVRIRIGGTPNEEDGTLVTGPITLTEAATQNSAPMGGWVRIAYTFTATSTTLLVKVTDGAAGLNGDDLGLTGFGAYEFKKCIPPTTNNITAPIMNNSNGPTAIPALNGADPDGTIASILLQHLLV
jgi:hypothetical protein